MPILRAPMRLRVIRPILKPSQLRCFQPQARLSVEEDWDNIYERMQSRQGTTYQKATPNLPTRTQYTSLEAPNSDKYVPTETEIDGARSWLRKVGPDTIPKDEIAVTMSRSSGPGGQNVNKVETKVTLRVPFSSIALRVPKMLHETIKRNKWYAKNSDCMVIQSDGSRSRKANQDDAYQKLEGMLRSVGQAEIPNKTNWEQKEKVLRLQKSADFKRQKEKKAHSSKKASRRSYGD